MLGRPLQLPGWWHPQSLQGLERQVPKWHCPPPSSSNLFVTSHLVALWAHCCPQSLSSSLLLPARPVSCMADCLRDTNHSCNATFTVRERARGDRPEMWGDRPRVSGGLGGKTASSLKR